MSLSLACRPPTTKQPQADCSLSLASAARWILLCTPSISAAWAPTASTPTRGTSLENRCATNVSILAARRSSELCATND